MLSVTELLIGLGFMDVWVYQGVGNVKMFMNIFKIRVRNIFMQEWHSRLLNPTRSRFFITLANFNYQRYLEKSVTAKYRKLKHLRL